MSRQRQGRWRLADRPVDAICSRKYTALKTSGKRPVSAVKWIVLHDEEASSAQSAAIFFTTPAAQGSAHLCVDDSICYRTLLNTDVPWAAPGANEEGFHIEQAGFAKWSSVIWLSHRKTLQRAAYKTALHCKLFHIPVRFVGATGLKRGDAGITTHAECTKAFGPVGGHTDPGPLWPRRYFLRLVRGYFAQLSV